MNLVSQLLNTPYKLKKHSEFYDNYTKKKIWFVKEVNESGELSISTLSQKAREAAFLSSNGEDILDNEEEMAWVNEDDLRTFD